MRKVYITINVAIVCLILNACQAPPPITSPLPSPTLNRLPLATPSITSSVAGLSVTSNSCRPLASPTLPAMSFTANRAWQYWVKVSPAQRAFDVAIADNIAWVGTAFGVVRLDLSSQTCTTYSEPGPTHLILPIEDDHVFTVSELGIFYFDGQTWRHIELSGPALRNAQSEGVLGVDTLGVDVNGDLWMLQGRRYYYWHRFEGHVPPRDAAWLDLNSSSPLEGPPDLDWHLFTGGTVSCFSSEECKRSIAVRKRIDQPGTVHGLFALDVDGTFWQALGINLLHRNQDGSTLSLQLVPLTHKVVIDSKYGMWLATDDGLFVVDGPSLQRVQIGLEQNTLHNATDIAVDAHGDVWVASGGPHLQRLNVDNQEWRLVDTLDASSGLQYGLWGHQDLAAARDGGLWLQTNGYELLYYDGHSVRKISLPPTYSTTWNPGCWSPDIVDASGNVWSLDSGCSLWQFNPTSKKWQHHLTDEFVQKVSAGTDGAVYALNSENQIKLYPPARAAWQIIAQPNDLVETMVADNQGGLWVHLHNRGRLRWYQPGTTTPLTISVPADNYSAFFVDHQNNLWVSAPGKLLRFDGDTWKTVVTPPIGELNKMVSAPDGRLWFKGQSGVAVYDPAADK